MLFDTLGDLRKTPVLLIHGMLCTSAECMPFGERLSKKYHVIIPTLDGHCNDGTDLVSADEEARKIADYLAERNITHLALLQGSSMGAEVALAVKAELDRRGITVDCCFFDGGPFFHFVPPFRKFMYFMFSRLVKSFETGDPQTAAEKILDDPFVDFVASGKTEKYRTMIESMTRARRKFSDRTVRGMVDVCYKCDLPPFSEETQRSFTFFFSNNEPARKSRRRLMKAYPHAKFRSVNGYAHCGLQAAHPRSYAALLERAIKDSVR